MLTAPRRGTWFCEVTPRTPLPDLVLSFSARDRSPALNAFLDVIRKNWSVPRSTTGSAHSDHKKKATATRPLPDFASPDEWEKFTPFLRFGTELHRTVGTLEDALPG
jgi:hypothetical protein